LVKYFLKFLVCLVLGFWAEWGLASVPALGSIDNQSVMETTIPLRLGMGCDWGEAY